ncbi:MAG: hypothetical protein ACK2UU_16130, partial [Anaerolineae bacterium]
MEDHRLRRSILAILALIAVASPLPALQPALAQEDNCIDDVTGWTNLCDVGDVWLGSLENDVSTSCTPGE